MHGYSKPLNVYVIDNLMCTVLQVIRERYSSLDAISETGFEVQFEDKAISLAIPDDGVCLRNGWAITPLVSPIVSPCY